MFTDKFHRALSATSLPSRVSIASYLERRRPQLEAHLTLQTHPRWHSHKGPKPPNIIFLSPQRCQSPLWLLGDWRWGWRVFQQRELRNNVVVVQQALCLRPGSAAGRRRGLRKGGSWRSRVSSVWSFRAGKRGMRSLTSTSWSMHGSHSTGGQGLMELHGMWTWSYGTGWSRAGWTSLRYWAWRLRTFKSSSLVSSRYPGPVSHLSTTLGATIVGHCASSPLTR